MPIPPQIVANFHDLGFLLTWVPKLAGYVGRKYSEWTATRNTYLENQIIDYLNMEVGSSDLIIKPIIQDVPFGIAFPVQMTGFSKFNVSSLSAKPYTSRPHRLQFNGCCASGKFCGDGRKEGRRDAPLTQE
jgi:hypothetical protein